MPPLSCAVPGEDTGGCKATCQIPPVHLAAWAESQTEPTIIYCSDLFRNHLLGSDNGSYSLGTMAAAAHRKKGCDAAYMGPHWAVCASSGVWWLHGAGWFGKADEIQSAAGTDERELELVKYEFTDFKRGAQISLADPPGILDAGPRWIAAADSSLRFPGWLQLPQMRWSRLKSVLRFTATCALAKATSRVPSRAGGRYPVPGVRRIAGVAHLGSQAALRVASRRWPSRLSGWNLETKRGARLQTCSFHRSPGASAPTGIAHHCLRGLDLILRRSPDVGS